MFTSLEKLAKHLRKCECTHLAPISLTIGEQMWRGIEYSQEPWGSDRITMILGILPRATKRALGLTCYRYTGDASDHYIACYSNEEQWWQLRRWQHVGAIDAYHEHPYTRIEMRVAYD
jgi:hypothetical protein